jgi:APA family basic amino acid/polyamine antiporter
VHPVAALLTLTGTYGNLLDQTAFCSLLFTVLTVVGLFPRPYRVWGYPTHPVLYILVSSFFLICIPVANPVYSGRGIVLTLLGIPAYVYWRRASP